METKGLLLVLAIGLMFISSVSAGCAPEDEGSCFGSGDTLVWKYCEKGADDFIEFQLWGNDCKVAANADDAKDDEKVLRLEKVNGLNIRDDPLTEVTVQDKKNKIGTALRGKYQAKIQTWKNAATKKDQ